MFFLGEYSNMLLMSAVITLLFFGGWDPVLNDLFLISPHIWLAFKVVIFCFLFVLVRATFPRYRYDQLMDIGWKLFLPVTLAFFLFCATILYIYQAAPFSLEVETF
jgi:NADH-quinone oxidoreductase subunit H